MEKEKLRPYLVQRANFAEREGREGIDGILKFDYMGSAEFEWGALPKSLKRIRAYFKEYTYLHISMPKGIVITVLCKETDEPFTEMSEYLNGLMGREFRLKEYSDFDTLFCESKSEYARKNQTDFWWDIENDLMFWKKNDKFEENFKKRIT